MTQRISWGSINDDGSIANGSGDFQVSVIGPGQYSIAFNQGFSSLPAVVGSQNRFGNASEWSSDTVSFPIVNPDAFQANTGNGNATGNLQNRNFAFIAIGNN